MTIALSLTITTIITLAVLQRRLSDRKRLSNVSDAKAAAAAGAPPPPLHFTAPSLYVRVIDGVCQSCAPCLFANILPALVVCESKIVLDACWLMQPHTDMLHILRGRIPRRCDSSQPHSIPSILRLGRFGLTFLQLRGTASGARRFPADCAREGVGRGGARAQGWGR